MNTVSPRAAVIGTGRSGTGYMAAVLKGAGLDAGHEAYWHAHGGPRASQLDVDCSWLALPDIESGAWTGRVLHVVRHPVDTVRSLLGTRLFARESLGNPYALMARMNTRSVDTHLFDLDAAVAFWCEWNARCYAVADATLRLEDFNDDRWAKAVANTIGMGLDTRSVVAGVIATPDDVNTRDHPLPEVDPAAVWRRIGRRAHGFGYGA